MESLIFNNLFSFEDYGYLIPDVMNIVMIIAWLYLSKKLNLNSYSSLKMSLRLFGLSVLLLVLTLTRPAAIAAEYAFIIFVIGFFQHVVEYIKQR